jgi:predicted protein tyrosine phosphatase
MKKPEKLLFICGQNINRSKTAEHIFANEFQTRSAGLYNEYPVEEKHLAWADIVIVMDEMQRSEIQRRFPRVSEEKKIINIEVPDNFIYNQPELVRILKSRLQEIL